MVIAKMKTEWHNNMQMCAHITQHINNLMDLKE